MKASPQQPTRIRLCLSDESCDRVRPLRRNHVWRCDFAVVHTANGRAVRVLVIIDEFTRECLKMVVARSLGSREVLEALWGLFIDRGIPEYLRPDNGPEFSTMAVRQWLARVGVRTLFIEPGGPGESGHDELFVGKMRDELLNREVFETFQEARALMGRGEYDELRQHGSLDSAPPAPEGSMPEAGSAPVLEMLQSLGAVHPDSRLQEAPLEGEGGRADPPADRRVVEGQAPPAHRQAPHPATVIGTRKQEADLPDAPGGGDGGHAAPRRDGEGAGGQAPPAHRQAPDGDAVAAQEKPRRDLPGIRQGSPEEIELLLRGAEKGLSCFQLELGERYARGVKGASRNSAEARKWLTRAFHDPEFPEHKEQAAALLDELRHGMRAGSGRVAGNTFAAAVRRGPLKRWPAFVAVAAAVLAMLLWISR